MNNAMDNLDNPPLFVKLRNPPFADRRCQLEIPNNSPFARIRLKHLGNGKYGLRQYGFDWERALAHGHRPLSQEQQQQQTAPGDEPEPTPGVFKPEEYVPPPKHGSSKRSADGSSAKQASGRDKGAKLTMLTVEQILAYEDNPDDILLSNGYLERGSPCVLCGPPGIGKSRLALQLAVKSILGQEFLGWETNALGLKWAFLQNENGLRRLKADLRGMCKSLSSPQMEALEKNLLIHAIVNDWDGDLDLGDVDARKRIVEVIQDWKPDVVVGDPLTAFSLGDLNSDQEMLNTARDFGRIVRQGDPRRIPFLIHHARTGKEARAGVAGADRSSYARNSKALYGWTRSQFNVAPIDKDNNERLLFASGKCNNAPEFPKFIIELDPADMFYAKTDEDPDAALEEMQGEDGKFKQKYDRKQILGLMSSLVPLVRENIKRDAIDKIHMSDRTFNTLWAQLKEFGEIEKAAEGKWLKK